MSPPTQLLLFTLDGWRYAVPLEEVDRIVRAAEVTPLPGSPEIVLGVLDVAGEVWPVVNLRPRFRRPNRNLRISDHFLLLRTVRRPLAVLIDEALGVQKIDREQIRQTTDIVPGLGPVRGVAVLPDGLVMIQDVDALLSLEEEAALEIALSVTGGRV